MPLVQRPVAPRYRASDRDRQAKSGSGFCPSTRHGRNRSVQLDVRERARDRCTVLELHEKLVLVNTTTMHLRPSPETLPSIAAMRR